MKKTWLVHRLNAPTNGANPFAFGGGFRNGGISDGLMKKLMPIFSFDYMGAAEYEFGDTAEALELMLSGQKLVSGQIQFLKTRPEVVAYYICNASDEYEVRDRIIALYKGKLNTREYVYLKRVFDKEYEGMTRGWLELDNGFAFFVDREMWIKFGRLFELNLE
jgi:hypothetical protein